MTQFAVTWRPRRRSNVRLILGSVSAVALACAAPPSPQEPLQLRLTSGGTVRQLLPEGRAVLLVYDPATALSCASAWERWRDWGRQNHAPVLLVLRGTLSREDRQALLIRRQAPVGAIVPSLAEGAQNAEYLIEHGVVLRKGPAPSNFGLTSELLESLETPRHPAMAGPRPVGTA